MRLANMLIYATLFTGVAYADTTYSYQGPNFTLVSGSYTTDNLVTGSFTLAQALDPSSTTTVLGPYDPGSGYVVPLFFSFTDGVQTLSSFDGDFVAGSFTTDSNGDISSYAFAVLGAAGGSISISIDDTGVGMTTAVSSGSGSGDSAGGTFMTSTASAATPEPSSFALLGTGLLCGALLANRRLTSLRGFARISRLASH